MEQRKKPESCIPDDVYGDMQLFMKEILSYFLFEKEFRELTDNSFFTNASRDTISDIRQQFFRADNEYSGIASSFKKAAESEIYPEMIRSTAYMFEISRLLSKKYGKPFRGIAVTSPEGKNYGFSI
jgi:hypothetical protein